MCIYVRGNFCSYVWIKNIPEPVPRAGEAALSPQVPACGHPHIACSFLLAFWGKTHWSDWFGLDHTASARKAMIFMFCSPGAAGNACLNRKYCLYKSCLQHRAGWEWLLLSNAHKERGGKGAVLPVWCLCCWAEGEAWGKEILKLMRSWACIW